MRALTILLLETKNEVRQGNNKEDELENLLRTRNKPYMLGGGGGGGA